MALALTQIKKTIKHIYFGLRYATSRLRSETLPSKEAAMATLHDYWPDPQNTVFCENNLHTPQWDLTIVVPIYNVQEYLAECMESVLHQNTHYTYHVIAVNDGSTDGSAEILAQFSDCNNLTVIHQENCGLSGARNAAIKDIYSKYLMFVDSDDVLTENAVEVLMDEAYGADADIVQGSYVSFQHETGKILGGEYFAPIRSADHNTPISGTAWGKVYKAKLWKQLRFPEDYWYEDTVITSIHAHLAHSISTLSDVVYRYRIRAGSITAISAAKKQAVDAFWMTQCVLSARAQLSLVCDDTYYTYLLRQAVLNYKRTAKQPLPVKKSIFVLTRVALIKQRPKHYAASHKRYAHLENAILHGTYHEYCYRCSVWQTRSS